MNENESAASARSPKAPWWRGGHRRKPVVVGVDLWLMQPGGANGGVKPLVFSFLEEIVRARGGEFRFVYFASRELAPELGRFARTEDAIVTDASERAEWDVLYAPFGRSVLMAEGRPAVSLVVDLLHRDLPSALPVEEVNFRHAWFTQIAREAALFQCISHYTAGRLQAHYGVAPERCFVTHVAVQERLADARGEATPPLEGEYFFYPANSWPHKNHEALFEAYRRYREGGRERAWPLILTGYPDARMHALEERAAAMGLAGAVQFLGHLDVDHFVATWRGAGALVYPSLHEGFGIPLLEAMKFGCPIIAANTTSLPEVGGDACVYVDPRNVPAVAAVLAEVAGNAALRQDLVRRGARRLREFSLVREAAKLADRLRHAARGLIGQP